MIDESTTDYTILENFSDYAIGEVFIMNVESTFNKPVFFKSKAFGEFHLNDNSSISNSALSSSSIFNSVLEMSFKSEFKNKEQDKILEALCKDYFYNHFYEWINL